ncbi:MAG: lantibiotic dehydratase [Acidobacteriota bacterium]
MNLVPTLLEPGERRSVLKLKRTIFNGRVVSGLPEDVLPPSLRREVETYVDLARELEGLIDRARQDVLSTARDRLQALLEEPDFAAAVRAASPHLAADLARGASADGDELTTIERSLYSYAARFFSKANPFHLFASVQIPDEPEDGLQISFEPAGLLALESELLPHAADADAVHWALAPNAGHGERCLFWITDRRGFRLRALPIEAGLEAILELFSAADEKGVSVTDARWRDFLASKPAPVKAAAELAQGALLREGALVRYLLTDLGDLEPLVQASAARGEDGEELVRAASMMHLERLRSADDLTDREPRLAKLAEGLELRHHVNAYGQAPPVEYHDAAAELSFDLTGLKPIFESAGHTFTAESNRLQTMVVDALRRKGGAAPYLEILTEVLVRRQKGPDSEHKDSASPGRMWTLSARRRADWLSTLSALEGELLPAELASLVSSRPAAGVEADPSASLCFNGTRDAGSGLYTLSNIFSGDGRFISRYHLDRSARSPKTFGEVLDVEVAVPPVPAMNYVVPGHAFGIGLESRYRHRYRHWIDVRDLELTLSSPESGQAQVVYRQRSTGRRLRLHYRGFLLASQLPTQYQLMLLGHGDSFYNPFLRPAPAASDQTIHEPGLRYGLVRLRREAWVLSRQALREAPRAKDPLLFAVELRDWLHGRLGSSRDHWFYAVLKGPSGIHKPHFLDLGNPLSVHAFRRTLKSVPKGGGLRFTALDTPIEELTGHRVRELMIEV